MGYGSGVVTLNDPNTAKMICCPSVNKVRVMPQPAMLMKVAEKIKINLDKLLLTRLKKKQRPIDYLG